jgi:hypothetical protein
MIIFNVIDRQWDRAGGRWLATIGYKLGVGRHYSCPPLQLCNQQVDGLNRPGLIGGSNS